mgnify:CR=1 FL=1
MPGSAELDPDVLVDSLVADVIDGLREDLHPQFGVRAYRVYTVRRSWSGEMPGEGSVLQEVELELRPQPLVAPWDGFKFDVTCAGLDTSGLVKLTEVSLTYTEAELVGFNLGPGEEWFLKITDAHGQGTTPRYYTHDKPPFIDRVKDMGWILWLRKVEA